MVGRTGKQPSSSEDLGSEVLYRGNEGMGEKDTLTTTIAIESNIVGRIIGKGGAHIQRYKKESGAYISLSTSTRNNVGAYRFAEITGNVDEVVMGITLIGRALVENIREGDHATPASRNGALTVSILCPEQSIGFVMGKKGSIVQAIRAESKAGVSIKKFSEANISQARSIHVHARNKHDLKSAVNLICRQIAHAKHSSKYKDLPKAVHMRPGVVPLPSVQRITAQGGPLVAPLVPRFPSIPPLMGGVVNAGLVPLAGGLKSSSLDLKQIDVQAALAGVDTKVSFQVKVLVVERDCGKLFGQGGSVLQSVRQASGCSRIKFSEPEPGEDNRVAILEGPSTAIVVGLSLFAFLLGGDYLQSKVQITLLIHSGRVGYIIGKAGARINAIRKESGAQIGISEEEYGYGDPGAKDNKVTLSGPPLAVSKAISRVIYHLQKIAEEAAQAEECAYGRGGGGRYGDARDRHHRDRDRDRDRDMHARNAHPHRDRDTYGRFDRDSRESFRRIRPRDSSNRRSSRSPDLGRYKRRRGDDR
mmetsp:Transcript_19600/g.34949  ORF Transcript_19600/g.34949 Transcript_19600/m.34949 type:complete len:531 (-) Transcript_19600:97-1689(-)